MPPASAHLLSPMSDHSAAGMRRQLAAEVILRFTQPQLTERFHMEQRTSDVCGPPRILTDAWCPSHACQGALPPWTPTKGDAAPRLAPRLIPPARRSAEAVVR